MNDVILSYGDINRSSFEQTIIFKCPVLSVWNRKCAVCVCTGCFWGVLVLVFDQILLRENEVMTLEGFSKVLKPKSALISIFSAALSKPYLTAVLNPTIPSVLCELFILGAACMGQQLCLSKQAGSELLKPTGRSGLTIQTFLSAV